MNWIIDNGVAIVSALISVFSIYYARKANDKSDEANQLSRKSIAINYDAVFNEFNSQLRNNQFKVARIKRDFEKIKAQRREYVFQSTIWIIRDITILQAQKQYARPSVYHNHYEEMGRLGENIKAVCEILQKIAESSEGENIFKNKVFEEKYIETLSYFDLMDERLKKLIDNDIYNIDQA